jgi:type IV pilus assembly protein PilZ
MRLPIVMTTGHKGKSLEIDSQHEVIWLVGARGERLGSLSWAALIEYILGPDAATRAAESRIEPRVSLLVKVRYGLPGSKRAESHAVGIGLGGMFIETGTPLALGTDIEVEFALPDRPSDWVEVKGTVAWVCPKADQYTRSPGMGIRFNEISTEARQRVMEVVSTLKWAGR